jgi:deazaflavin-dependent oxidoreductase (nitroreductase family)
MFKLPVLLYRARLGWLLGKRFVLVEHLGRRSGKVRWTVVEVVGYDSTDRSCVVAAGFGARSDWYRNLTAHPQTHIRLGRRRIGALAVAMPVEEGAQVMLNYARHHRVLAPHLCRLMGFQVDGSDHDYRAVGQQVPFVRLNWF